MERPETHYLQSFSVHWPEEPLPLANTISNLLQNMRKRKALESNTGILILCILPVQISILKNEAFSRGELSKEAYWTEMVKITMDVIKKLRDQINAYLRIKLAHLILRWLTKRYYFPYVSLVKRSTLELGMKMK